MAEASSSFIPALSFRWLTPLYDPLLKWGMREETFKQRLIAQAGIRPGDHVLDLGCGTGTLTVMLKKIIPEAIVTGMDGDQSVLEIAERKAAQASVSITWDKAMAYSLPYTDASFERVLSSLVIHHLTGADKLRAFKEVKRILWPGGEFHIVDFGQPHTILGWLLSQGMRHLEETKENFTGQLPDLLVKAGFAEVTETASMTTIFGPISLLRGRVVSK
jgi:ubiquinone/menaquinone biosynthesis C-methylase UbiE